MHEDILGTSISKTRPFSRRGLKHPRRRVEGGNDPENWSIYLILIRFVALVGSLSTSECKRSHVVVYKLIQHGGNLSWNPGYSTYDFMILDFGKEKIKESLEICPAS